MIKYTFSENHEAISRLLIAILSDFNLGVEHFISRQCLSCNATLYLKNVSATHVAADVTFPNDQRRNNSFYSDLISKIDKRLLFSPVLIISPLCRMMRRQ